MQVPDKQTSDDPPAPSIHWLVKPHDCEYVSLFTENWLKFLILLVKLKKEIMKIPHWYEAVFQYCVEEHVQIEEHVKPNTDKHAVVEVHKLP